MLELVREAVSSPGGVVNSLGMPTVAGITTLHHSDKLTILNVVWAPRMAIHPHDHRTWAVIGIYGGQEDNAFFRRRPEGAGLEQVNGRSLVEEETIALGPDVIHAVTNSRLAYTGALHVYGGDFFAIQRSEWPSAEAAEEPYNMDHTLRAFAQANEKAKTLKLA